MKKLSVTALLIMFIVLTVTGCSHQTYGTAAKGHSDTIAPGAIDEILTDDDFTIPEVALQWQERNAPIFTDDNFYDKYVVEKNGEYHIDLRKAMESIEINVSYDQETESITIIPQKELGPIMFQFTLFCVPILGMDDIYTCWEYSCEFMHANGNPGEWYQDFFESEPLTDETAFYIIDIDGREFYLTENVFLEVDATIATIMSIKEEAGEA